MNNKIEKRKRLGKIFSSLLEEWGKTETQVSLANLAGLNPSMISAAKNGDKWFYMDTVEDIARVLHIPTEYFELADERLTVAENKKMINLLMELRNNFILATLVKK